MSIWTLLVYVLVGGFAGLVGGLLGISGGVVTVPSLYFFFHWLELAPGYEMHLAIGTSLASMVFNSVSSTWAHAKHGAVVWPIVKKMAPGILLGSILGALHALCLMQTICVKVSACRFFFLIFKRLDPATR